MQITQIMQIFISHRRLFIISHRTDGRRFRGSQSTEITEINFVIR